MGPRTDKLGQSVRVHVLASIVAIPCYVIVLVLVLCLRSIHLGFPDVRACFGVYVWVVSTVGPIYRPSLVSMYLPYIVRFCLLER